MATFQFVDSVSGSAGLRLDLHSEAGGLLVAGEGYDLSPPPLRRVVDSSMLEHGDRIPAAAFGNRTIRLPLQFKQTSNDNTADKLQLLARELARTPGNVLKMAVGSNAMYFRTLPSPDAAWEMKNRLERYGKAVCEIQAEPFGYGVKETIGAVTVNNDPAAGSNGMFLDVSSVKGDVETPLYLVVPSGIIATGRRQSAIAVRRRGTVANVPFVLQAEAMTQGTDTSIQANNASFSGGGSNFSRTTFSTASGITTRLSLGTFPASASVDARGTYRVFVRFRQNTSGDTIQLQLQWGATGGSGAVWGNGRVTPTNGNTNLKWVDLGLMQIPAGADPMEDGISGTALSHAGQYVEVRAARTAGSGSIDLDALLFVPADDRFMLTKWPASSGPTDFVVDGRTSAVYPRGASGEVRTPSEFVEVAGGGLDISPGVTNRVYFVRDVGTTSSAGDAISGTTSISGFYWPRYLFALKPTST